MENNKDFSFLARHAESSKKKKESKEYPGLAEDGVLQARETARGELLTLIKNAPEQAVIFIGGASDQLRAKSTAKVYGDELSTLEDDLKAKNITVITKDDIDRMATEKDESIFPGQPKRTLGVPGVVKKLQKIIAENPGKVVIDYPLMINQFAYKHENRWTDKEGENTEYFNEILKKYGGDHTAAGLDWLENQGVLTVEGEKKIHGPNPTQVARDYLEGIKRLRVFVGKYTKKPIIVGGVGHQWDLDAVSTYLAGGGKDVTIEGFRQVAGDSVKPLIGHSEVFSFNIDGGKTALNYRGKKLTIDKDSEIVNAKSQ